MFKATKISSKGKRKSDGLDYVNYVIGTENIAIQNYTSYVTTERSMSRWIGTGSKMLGLEGDVDGDTLRKLAQGYDPLGRELVEGAGTDRHYNGLDCTMSAPKSVSTCFMMETEERQLKILACQDKAVAAVTRFIEEQNIVGVNRGKQGKIKLDSQGIVAGAFTHTSSRSLDPQIHTHLFLLNMAKGVDGKWSCIENHELFRYTKAIGAVYRSVLAHELHKDLGYGIRQTIGRDGYGEENGLDNFEIEGIALELNDHFSQRSKEVEAYKKLHPNAQNAAVATRKRKDEPCWDELKAEWQMRLDYLREHHPEWLPDIEGLVGRKSIVRERTQDEVLHQLHLTEACITRPKLLERLALDHVGESLDELLAREKAFVESPSINVVAPLAQPGPKQTHSPQPSLEHKEYRYTADFMLGMESENTEYLKQSLSNATHKVDAGLVARKIADYEAKKQKELKNPDFKLKDEQRNMVEHLCTNSSSVAIAVGWAGTGKTTACQALVDVYNAHSIDGNPMKLLGAAPSWKAAKKLQQEAGIECRALASIATSIENGNYKVDRNTVLLIDEASLMGSKSFNTIVRAFQESGDPGKIILLGDPHQLQAVEAGSPLRAGIDICGASHLHQITRQKTKKGLDIAHATYKGHDDKKGARTWRDSSVIGLAIYKEIDDAGWVHECETGRDCIKGLVKDYLRDGAEVTEKVAIASTNYEVMELNKAIREGLQKAGKVSSMEHTVTVQTKSGMQDIEVAVGDRLRFKKQYGKRAENAEDCTVEHISKNRFTGALEIQVVMDDKAINGKERRFVIDTLEFNKFIHAYAMTVHGSQGQTLDKRTYWVADSRIDQHLAAVALTRSREETHLYIIEDDAEDISKAMGKQRLKDNVLEEGIVRKSSITLDQVKQQKSLQKAIATQAKTVEDLRESIRQKAEEQKVQKPQIPAIMAEHFSQEKHAEQQKRGKGRGR